MSLWLICYDVGDDRRRTRLHKLLSEYGEPVEESVFEVDLPVRRLRSLRGKILKVVDRDVDVVRIYPLCQDCAPRVDVVVGPPRRARPLAHIL